MLKERLQNRADLTCILGKQSMKRALSIYYWHQWGGSASCVGRILATADDELTRLWDEKRVENLQLPPLVDAVRFGREIEERYRGERTVLICPGESDYPVQLNVLRHPPILGVKGDVGILSQSQMAMVGSRHTIEASRMLTPVIADALMMSGYVITSGGAVGIDALAHRQAMVREQPTVVVSALGTDAIYPKENADIFEYAAQCGAVVSQFPNVQLRHKPNFPLRNDVIAGLSEGVVVVQCPQKSGAMYTVNAARRFQRPVFAAAMPGFEPLTEGGLMCIKSQQAQLLSALQDLSFGKETKQKTLKFDVIQTQKLQAEALPESMMSATQTAIIQALSRSSMTREILRQTLNLPGDFDEAVLELELNGYIQTVGGVMKCA